MYYEYNPTDLDEFIREMGYETRRKGNEIEFKYCPICKSSKSDQWKAAINYNTGLFNCPRASCPLPHLNFFQLCREVGYTVPNVSAKYYKPKQIKPQEINTSQLAVNYLALRGISKNAVQKYCITSYKQNPELIVFPFYDNNGICCLYKLRHTKPKPENYSGEWAKEFVLKFDDMTQEDKFKPVLFGMLQCDPSFDNTLIITEGQIDTLAVATAGYKNVVSVPYGKSSFGWVKICKPWIDENFKKIIVFGDHENNEITLYQDVKERFPEHFVVHIAENDYLDCKDADELLIKYGVSAVQEAIEHAKCKNVNGINPLSVLKTIDFSQLEKIPTGFGQIDKITGGLILGRLTVIVGKRGDGKSTLANQIIANVLKFSSESVVVYSGELDGGTLKDRLLRALSNPDGSDTELIDDVIFGKHYKLKVNSEISLNQKYGKRVLVFDNDFGGDVLDTITDEITYNGERIILIDNLMSLVNGMDFQKHDTYTMQSNVVTRLAKLSHSKGVAIILVVHPRKETKAGDALDKISGSADIANAADTVLEIQKERDERKKALNISGTIFVRKNRLNGWEHFGNDEGVKIVFDEKTKQIHSKDFRENINKNKSTEKPTYTGFL